MYASVEQTEQVYQSGQQSYLNSSIAKTSSQDFAEYLNVGGQAGLSPEPVSAATAVGGQAGLSPASLLAVQVEAMGSNVGGSAGLSPNTEESVAAGSMQAGGNSGHAPTEQVYAAGELEKPEVELLYAESEEEVAVTVNPYEQAVGGGSGLAPSEEVEVEAVKEDIREVDLSSLFIGGRAGLAPEYWESVQGLPFSDEPGV